MANVKWRLSADLNDGERETVVKTPQQVADAAQAWADNCGEDDCFPGDGFDVKAIAMTDEEFDALPEL